MLPKKKRVTKEVFRALLKGGKTFSTQLFLFYYTNTGSPQYAFATPKNIFKNAVKRNKYRRIGYGLLKELSLEKGSGVFMYKKQAITATLPEIKINILLILKKTGLLP